MISNFSTMLQEEIALGRPLKNTQTRNFGSLLTAIRSKGSKSKLLDISRHPSSHLLRAIRSIVPADVPKDAGKNRSELMCDIRTFQPDLELRIGCTVSRSALNREIREARTRKCKVPRNRRALLSQIRDFDRQKLVNREFLHEEIQFFPKATLNHVHSRVRDEALRRSKLLWQVEGTRGEIRRRVELSKVKNVSRLMQDIRGFPKKVMLKKVVPLCRKTLLQKVRAKVRGNKLVPWERHLHLIRSFRPKFLHRTTAPRTSNFSKQRDAVISDISRNNYFNWMDLNECNAPIDRMHLQQRIRAFPIKKLRERKRDTRCFQSVLREIRSFKRSKLKRRNTLMKEIRLGKNDLINRPLVHWRLTRDSFIRSWSKTMLHIKSMDTFYVLDYIYGTKNISAFLSEVRGFNKKLRCVRPFSHQKLLRSIREFDSDHLKDWRSLNEEIRTFKSWKLRCQVTDENRYLDRVSCHWIVEAMRHRTYRLRPTATRKLSVFHREKILAGILSPKARIGLLSTKTICRIDLLSQLRGVSARMKLNVIETEPKSRTSLLQDIRNYDTTALWEAKSTRIVQELLQQVRGHQKPRYLLDDIKLGRWTLKKKTWPPSDISRIRREIANFDKEKLKKRAELLTEIIMFHPQFLTKSHASEKSNLERELLLKEIRDGNFHLFHAITKDIKGLLSDIRGV